MKNIALFIFFIFIIKIQAQSNVTEVAPANQAITAEPNGEVSITFDTPLSLPTISAYTAKIFGRWSGPGVGNWEVVDDGKRLVFTPTQSFFNGEMVSVLISKSVEDVNGISVGGYTWSFWIKTEGGILDQPLEQTIQLREDNEGWIQTYGAYAGDMNNDGWSDLVMVNENSDDLRILLNDGTGHYPAMTIYPMGDSKPSPNEGADFNMDGEIDLAVSTAHGNELRILTGDGNGGFSNMTVYNTGDAARGLGVLDFDMDGNDDVLIANRGSSELSFFVNDGTGLFSDSTFTTPWGAETAVAIADANNDGIMDAFVGYYNSTEIVLFLGDGNGKLIYSSFVNLDAQPWMIAAGDVNGDGNVDVVSANSWQDNTQVILGDGNGGMGTPTVYAQPDGEFPLAIDLGDLDGDGDLDMVVSNYNGNNFYVYENTNNTGNFTHAVTLPASTNASCAILHDRDNDGDLDITATDETDDVALLYLNGSLTNTPNIQEDKISFSVFPNPVSQEIEIQFPKPLRESVDFFLYDIFGNEVLHQTNTTTLIEFENISLESLPSGNYILKIKSGNSISHKKIIKI